MADQKGSRSSVDQDGAADSDLDDSAAPLINHDTPDAKFASRNNNASPPPKREGDTPAERVRNLLMTVKDEASSDDGESGSDSSSDDGLANVLGQHYLFCQLNRLCHFPDGKSGWKEISRWLKYEEKVDMGERWSKPHVATSSLHALLHFRSAIADGSAVIDLDTNATHGCVNQVVDILLERIREQSDLTSEQLEKIVEILGQPYKHSNRQADQDKKKERRKAEHETKAHAESEVPTKKKKGQRKGDINNIPLEYHVYASNVVPDDLKPYKPNKKFSKKVPRGAEVVNLMVGQVDFLDKPIMALARLSRGTVLHGISEVPLPSRFVFLCLGPKDDKNIREYEDLGRAVGTLFSDKVFAEVAYRATSRQDIQDGLDEYMDELTVLPPSLWDPNTRLAPPHKVAGDAQLRKRLNISKRYGEEMTLHVEESGDPTLKRTGRIFGGLVADAKRRYAQYKSDITDGLHIQCVACIVFLFFACITPIVTFGGLMGTATDGLMGTMECILSGAICGILFSLFAGQPLTIVGATGPLLIFESILYQFCKEQGVDFMAFRFWVGSWCALILFIVVMFDLSFLVSYITRFTEESFSVLISLIFIMEAFKKILGVWSYSPVHTNVIYEELDYNCYCVNPGNTTSSPPVVVPPEGVITFDANVTADGNYTISNVPFNPYNWSQLVLGDCITQDGRVEVHMDCLHADECTSQDWSLIGDACHDHGVTHGVPDVFFLSLFLFVGTFVLAMFFRNWRGANYFPSIVRSTVADFAVFMSVMINTGIDIAFGIATPKLNVPETFATTLPGRGWLVNPFNLGDSWYMALLAFLPAILGTILIFLDQQITAVIINRKDHKLKKGPGYHLDLLVLSVTLVICSFLGLPWFVAATVRSITHVKALTKLSETSAPGETPEFVGIREQRFTAFCIHVLIAMSVLITPILKFIPMPVLYGVFLYMGVTSLAGVQFIDRIKILLMPAKYQPDYIYLRHVPSKRVHIFTGLQIVCMMGMWVVKSIKKIAIMFPLLVLALCFVRKAMDFWFFTQQDMYWLDHIMPEADRRKKEDEASGDEKDLIEAKDKGWPLENLDGKGSKAASTASLKKEKV